MQEQKTLISPMKKLTDEERLRPQPLPPTRSPEEIQYIMFIVFKEDCREQTFRICQGRTEAGEEARLLVLEDADLDESKVFMGHQSFDSNQSISLYWFLRRCMDVGCLKDPNFDVDEFMVGDPIESQQEANSNVGDNEIPTQVNSMYSSQQDNGQYDI